jgi:hypothetical protein
MTKETPYVPCSKFECTVCCKYSKAAFYYYYYYFYYYYFLFDRQCASLNIYFSLKYSPSAFRCAYLNQTYCHIRNLFVGQ